VSCLSPLTPNDLKRRRTVSPLKLKSPVKICLKNQQIHQLFIRFINYVRYLLHVSALHCHPQGAFLVPSERCSVEEQSRDFVDGVLCLVAWCTHHATRHNTPIHNILSPVINLVRQRCAEEFNSGVKWLNEVYCLYTHYWFYRNIFSLLITLFSHCLYNIIL
jgi:hypothetical protein